MFYQSFLTILRETRLLEVQCGPRLGPLLFAHADGLNLTFPQVVGHLALVALSDCILSPLHYDLTAFNLFLDVFPRG